MKTPRNARRLTVAALIALPATLIGCSSSSVHHAGDIDSIRWDPSPAMDTTAQRRTDRTNDWTRMKDTSLRALTEDIDNTLYINRPTRLYHGVKP